MPVLQELLEAPEPILLLDPIGKGYAVWTGLFVVVGDAGRLGEELSNGDRRRIVDAVVHHQPLHGLPVEELGHRRIESDRALAAQLHRDRHGEQLRDACDEVRTIRGPRRPGQPAPGLLDRDTQLRDGSLRGVLARDAVQAGGDVSHHGSCFRVGEYAYRC